MPLVKQEALEISVSKPTSNAVEIIDLTLNDD